jgi:hypothetical protein
MASKRHTLAASMGLSRSGQKDSHHKARAAKVQLRRAVLAEIGPADAHVFDAFAGTGDMHAAVWCQAASYVACDQRWMDDDRLAFVADNRRVMRAIDLAPFNVFDLDAYGSPWEQVLILCARRRVRPGERLAVLLTEGSGLNLRMGGMPHALRTIADLSGIPAAGKDGRAELLERAIAGMCKRLGAVPVRRWDADGHGGASVRYVALVLEGKRPAQPVAQPSVGRRKIAERRAI